MNEVEANLYEDKLKEHLENVQKYISENKDPKEYVLNIKDKTEMLDVWELFIYCCTYDEIMYKVRNNVLKAFGFI